MTAVLGISAFYHDSAAAIVVDGTIVAAAQEERFSRVKNDSRFPSAAIAYCLQEAGLNAGALDYVGFYEKPLLKFDRIIENYCAFAPRGFRSFRRGMPSWLKQKLHVNREISDALGGEFGKRFLFAEHHESHAASAFFPSPFEEAAVLTVDGVGEWATATCGVGRGSRVELTHELRFPHSLGLLYSAFTHYCGFEVDSGEYKLMGLAPYGEPKYVDLILERLVDVKPDGSLRLDLSYFNYCYGLTMTSPRFHRLFGGPPRSSDSPIEDRHLDIAASIQKVTERILLRMAQHVHDQTGLRQLCLAGGVALNCVANSQILRDGPFEQLWIQPAAGDSGGALGAALLVWHQLLGQPRVGRGSGDSPLQETAPPSDAARSAGGGSSSSPASALQTAPPLGATQPLDAQFGSLLGPSFSAAEVRACLEKNGAVFHELSDEHAVCERTAQLLADEKVVGWMQGRMEFGPRALGSRSILADARSTDMQRVLNLKIKFRESFRPFAPAVLDERTDDYFEMPRGQRSPYMLLVGDVARARRKEIPTGSEPHGLDKLHVSRSEIPAVTHVDNSARVQSVDDVRHPKFAALLRAFNEATGCPLVINTSFNVRDEPIVCTPQDAYACFMATGMDALVIESFLLLKDEQPDAARPPTSREIEAPTSGWSSSGDTSFVEIPDDPTPRQLRIFGGGLVVIAVGLLAVALMLATRSLLFWRTFAAAASGLAVVYLVFPSLRRSILRTWMQVTYPLSWFGSQLSMGLSYYLVLSPIGFCMRLFGRDPMQRHVDREAATYWCDRPPPPERDRYLRQF